MIDWIVQNIVSIVIVLVITVLFAVAVISLIRNGKKNKRCSCGCEGCIYSSGCKRAVTKDPGIEK